MQRKLSRSEVAELGGTLDKLDRAAEIVGCNDARQYFPDAVDMLANMRIHGTSDGNPWVEPEPEVVIDDKWAAVWPRRLAMFRDEESHPWTGPMGLIGVVSGVNMPFITENGTEYSMCRPATADEIATIEHPEPASKGNDEVCQKRFRDLAIDAAVLRLISAKHPTLTQIEIQRRSRIDSMRGHGYYTVFFDDKPVATVSISIESSRRFTIDVLDAFLGTQSSEEGE